MKENSCTYKDSKKIIAILTTQKKKGNPIIDVVENFNLNLPGDRYNSKGVIVEKASNLLKINTLLDEESYKMITRIKTLRLSVGWITLGGIAAIFPLVLVLLGKGYPNISTFILPPLLSVFFVNLIIVVYQVYNLLYLKNLSPIQDEISYALMERDTLKNKPQ